MYQRLEGVNKIVPKVMRRGDLFCKEKKTFPSLEFHFDKFSVRFASKRKGLLLVLEILGDYELVIKDENVVVKKVC